MKRGKHILWKTIGTLAILFSIASLYAQDVGVAVNSDKSAPNANAILDIKSPATGNGKGLLIPRITQAQRTNASAALAGGLLDDSGDLRGGVAAQGLLVYQTDGTQGFYYNNSITTTPNWIWLGGGTGTTQSVATGTGLTGGPVTEIGTISITNGGVTETQLNTSVAGNGLSGGGGTSLAVSVDDTTIEINADTLQLKDSGVTAGTYKSVTVDAKGRATAAANPTTLAGFGITDALNTSRTITSGNGLTGGGDLTADKNLAVGDGAGITVNADDIAVNVDNTTIEINGTDKLQIKDAGLTTSQITSSAAANTQTLTADGSGNSSWNEFADVKSTSIVQSETPVNTNLTGYTQIGKVNFSFSPVMGTNAASTWTATTASGAPEVRKSHKAVWTGSEMIVWGGDSLNTGGRYNPTTDSWIAISMINVPTARTANTAIWTGSEMIVWGGYDNGTDYNTGGRYNPTIDSWTATSIGVNVPSARRRHTTIWTGSEMIIWGGIGDGYQNTGGRYNPTTDSWISTSTGTNVPVARSYHTAIWTGSEMIIWGGSVAGNLNTGSRYTPTTDSWTLTSTGTNVPAARSYHTAIWTGSEMIVWGGVDGSWLNTGGRYNPRTNSWTLTSMTDVPSGKQFHSALWTGSEMIVWGGYGGNYFNTGGRYDLIADTWSATSMTNAPLARRQHTAIWTGSEMIVWGGSIMLVSLTPEDA